MACTGPVKLVSTTSITSTLSPEAILYGRAFFQSTERTDSRTTTTIFLTVSRRRLLCRRFARQHLSSSRNTAHSGRRVPNSCSFTEHFPFHSRVHRFTTVKEKNVNDTQAQRLSSSGLRTPTNLESASGLPAIRLLTGRHLAPISSPSRGATPNLFVPPGAFIINRLRFNRLLRTHFFYSPNVVELEIREESEDRTKLPNSQRKQRVYEKTEFYFTIFTDGRSLVPRTGVLSPENHEYDSMTVSSLK